MRSLRIFVANHRSVSACIAPVQVAPMIAQAPSHHGEARFQCVAAAGRRRAGDRPVRAGIAIVPAFVEHVVGGGQTLRRLACAAMISADLFIGGPAARTHALDLQRLGTVDHADAVAALAVAARLDQQQDCGMT